MQHRAGRALIGNLAFDAFGTSLSVSLTSAWK